MITPKSIREAKKKQKDFIVQQGKYTEFHEYPDGKSMKTKVVDSGKLESSRNIKK